MTTVDDFAQGMLREYSAFAGRCAALVAEHGDEETAAELYSIDDLPQIAEQLRAFRVRAEAAEAALATARAEADAAGYRRAIDEACAKIDAQYDEIAGRGPEWAYDDGMLYALDVAEQAVRALAPVEPVSPADELPRGTP